MKIVTLLLTLYLNLLANPIIIAYLGGRADAPENTLTAIKLALKNKADAVWITVQMSKDKHFVLYHPNDLSSLTEKQGKIAHFDSKQLKKIYISKADKNIYNDEALYIPTLEEVLNQFPHTHFFVELKNLSAKDKEGAKILFELLKKTKSLKRVRVYTKNDDLVLNDDILRFATDVQMRKKIEMVRTRHLCQHQKQDVYYKLEWKKTQNKKMQKLSNVEFIDCLQKNRGKIILFNINNEADYQKAKALKIYGVVVDSPSFFKDRR